MDKLNNLRDKAYRCAVKHGWHEENLSDEYFLCMIIADLMEAVEADRKKHHANLDEFILETTDLNGNPRNGIGNHWIDSFETYIDGTVEERLANVCIRLFDISVLRNINFSSVSFPISNSAEHIESRKKLSFTEWCYDVTRVIVRYNKDKFPIGYLLVGILQEMCCIAEIIDFNILLFIELKIKYLSVKKKNDIDKRTNAW